MNCHSVATVPRKGLRLGEHHMGISVIRYGYCLLIFLLWGYMSFGQTEFDSLRRNSMLDTSYQPSKKATFITEFAELKISGFVQPALYFDNNNLLSNDLFVTSEIPTESTTSVNFRRFHMSANQSRLGFAFKFPQAKRAVSAFLEADFLSSSKGAHTYFRLRHAYVRLDNFTIGQTWTNFGDVGGAPNTVDLEGPNSMPASRVTQVSWKKQFGTKWSLLFAIEEPRADYTPLDSASAIKSAFPELVFKPVLNFKFGYWSNSFIYRQIVYSDKELSFKKKLPAWGYTSSLTIRLPDGTVAPLGFKKRTFNLFFIVGKGTQGSVNDFGGLGYEALPKNDSTLEPLSYFGGYTAYSFVWRKRWSSTFVYSFLHQEQPANIEQIFKFSNYFSGNAIFAINKYFTVGTELLHGNKENYDNSRGSAFRVQAILRLLF